MNDDLIKRLRIGHPLYHKEHNDAADEILRLEHDLGMLAVENVAAKQEIERLRAELAAVRSGDPCGRMCEGNAYRIEARRLAEELASKDKRLTAYENGWGEPATINELRKELAALKAQSEPAAYCVFEGVVPGFCAPVASMCHEHINEAINDYDLVEAAKWRVVPLYTHPQPADAETLTKARQLAAKQAEDPGLWFEAMTVTEAHLQAALRELTRAIEGSA
jgi:hypothetical protein